MLQTRRNPYLRRSMIRDPAEFACQARERETGALLPGTSAACGGVVVNAEACSADVSSAGYSDTRDPSATLALRRGDLLLLFCDGLVEAMDDRETLYGEERLRDLPVGAVAEELGARGVLERILWDVGRFTASTSRRDDVTAIVLRVTGGP